MTSINELTNSQMRQIIKEYTSVIKKISDGGDFACEMFTTVDMMEIWMCICQCAMDGHKWGHKVTPMGSDIEIDATGMIQHDQEVCSRCRAIRKKRTV